MVAVKQLNVLVLAIMIAITVLNTGLAFNFVSANGIALAAAFNGRNIYALAGVEMVLRCSPMW